MAISDPEVLYRSMRCVNMETAKLYAPHINAAMLKGEITTLRRAQFFLAQLAHESVDLRYFEEIASGAAYEGRRDLGNTQPGDGRRFKGRGPIQLTGRSNYASFGRWLGDGDKFTDDPHLVATPKYGFLAALYYWQTRNLNGYCDRGDFRGLTKRINGGFNGLADRYAKLAYVKRLGSKVLPAPAKPTDPLLPPERNAVERLAHWRGVARKTGWESDGKPTKAKEAAEYWKAHIPAHYVAAIDAAVARDLKGGETASTAWARRDRAERKRILLAAVDPSSGKSSKPKDDGSGHVRAVQAHLRRIGWPITVDGRDGPQTQRASRLFAAGYGVAKLSERSQINKGRNYGYLRRCATRGGFTTPSFRFREFASKGNGDIVLDRRLVLGLEKYRKRLGRGVSIVSGYRDPAHNARVGGASSSQHKYGKAADIRPELSLAQVRALGVFNGIGFDGETGRVRHVDVRPHKATWRYGIRRLIPGIPAIPDAEVEVFEVGEVER